MYIDMGIYIYVYHPPSWCVTSATRIVPGCSASPRGLQTLWTRPKLVGSGKGSRPSGNRGIVR